MSPKKDPPSKDSKSLMSREEAPGVTVVPLSLLYRRLVPHLGHRSRTHETRFVSGKTSDDRGHDFLVTQSHLTGLRVQTRTATLHRCNYFQEGTHSDKQESREYYLSVQSNSWNTYIFLETSSKTDKSSKVGNFIRYLTLGEFN